MSKGSEMNVKRFDINVEISNNKDRSIKNYFVTAEINVITAKNYTPKLK